MPTILLEQIIELLTGWKDSFFTWANAIGDKIASIKTNTDSLPDIKDNTDDIKDNTAAVITPISNINTNVSSISSDTASIRTDTGIIKNNAQAIATSSGQAAAYAQDVANNTLEVKNKVVTIASDTTQMRADSGAIRADVSEIKNTLGLYLYNTIVTEDAEGAIANFDTDLQDYLQNAKVNIPADAGGIAGFNLINCRENLYDKTDSSIILHAYINAGVINNNVNCTTVFIKCKPNTTYTISKIAGERFAVGYTTTIPIIGGSYYSGTVSNTASSITYTTGANAVYLIAYVFNGTYDTQTESEMLASVQIAEGTDTTYHAYEGNTQAITFGSSITDGAEVDLLSGIVKINTSPVTYDSITPLAIRTFKGVNNIYSDIGDMDATYRETLKHYLEKQDSNSRSLNRNVNLLRENISSTEDIVDDSDRRI